MIFISHSFDDAHRFDDLCLALEQRKIPFWDPKVLRGGASLRDQLRMAIEKCDMCIFLATRRSVESSWCHAELGAFWGSGKKVVVYVADPDLTDDKLPEQFKGDLWFRTFREIVNEADQTLQEAAKNRQVQRQSDTSPTRVGEISVGAFIDLLRSVLQPLDENAGFAKTMDRLAVLLSARNRAAGTALNPDLAAVLQPDLDRLIGEPIDSVRNFGTGSWSHGFNLITSSGNWAGYADHHAEFAHGDVDVFTGCLLVHLRQGCVDSCVVVTQVTEVRLQTPEKRELGVMIAKAGQRFPGEIASLGFSLRVEDNL